jgi:hypothetical protein
MRYRLLFEMMQLKRLQIVLFHPHFFNKANTSLAILLIVMK